jgi:ATP-dependent RNA helicase SUPV3L1/SUV3
VVNTMTSLIGASGEDFASILRSLGYRMERRPKPAEPAPAPVSVIESGPQEGAPETEGTAAQSQETVEPAMASPATEEDVAERSEPDEGAPQPRESEIDAPVAALAEPESAIPPVDFQEPEPQAAEPPAEAATIVPDGSLETSPPAETIAEPTKEAAEAAPSEPVLIEVWRPGRAEGRRRPPRPKRRGAGNERVAVLARQPAEAAATPIVATAEADSTPQAAPAEPATGSPPPREGRHFHQRRKGPPDRTDRPWRERERPPAHVRPERHERHERREKAADPNSPFAKLAALKAQLEAEAKERR